MTRPESRLLVEVVDDEQEHHWRIREPFRAQIESVNELESEIDMSARMRRLPESLRKGTLAWIVALMLVVVSGAGALSANAPGFAGEPGAAGSTSTARELPSKEHRFGIGFRPY